jgi:hypothetical protein
MSPLPEVTEPPPLGGGQPQVSAAAFLEIAFAVVASGAGHSAISGPPPTGGGSVYASRSPSKGATQPLSPSAARTPAPWREFQFGPA